MTRKLLQNVIPALLWSPFLLLGILSAQKAIATHAAPLGLLRTLMGLAFTCLIIALFVLRLPARSHAKPLPAIVAMTGTFITLLMAKPAPGAVNPTVEATSVLLTSLGLLWSLVSLAYLGRSFGILPEARELVTQGPYRIVRHPLYLGELVGVLGFAIGHPTAVNITLWLILVMLQSWRALNEERVLSDSFPAYAAYAARRPRLIPGIW